MSLLAIGDLHGDTDSLFQLFETEKPDGILCVGDWGDEGQIADAVWSTILQRVSVLTVYGNHDDTAQLSLLRNRDGSAVLLESGTVREFCGVTVGGISGIWAKSNRKPFYVTDAQVADYAVGLAQNPPAILLSHGCPIGVADKTVSGKSGGQICFLHLLRRVEPKLYFCGHLHVAQERLLLNPPTHVFNTGSLQNGDFVRISAQTPLSACRQALRRFDAT